LTTRQFKETGRVGLDQAPGVSLFFVLCVYHVCVKVEKHSMAKKGRGEPKRD
jgi:hypothetical protein